MNQRQLVQTVSVILLLAFLGYILADFGMLFVRGSLYPVQPPPARRITRYTPPPSGGSYGVITSRNIFNADQKIPPKVGATEGENKPADGPPVPSSLPIQLVGTIVHVNPKRSIASLKLGAKNEQVPVKVDGIIPDNLATVTKIERSKIIFRNHASQRLEFIEMKDEKKISFAAGSGRPVQQGEVTKISDTDFQLKREDINKLTSNLPDLLQQARAVPRMGPNGNVECFSLADIAPGSIYERLGLKRGDCIKSVNGERIDSPAKAMEMYNALRGSASGINLGIERDGRDNNFNYNIQ